MEELVLRAPLLSAPATCTALDRHAWITPGKKGKRIRLGCLCTRSWPHASAFAQGSFPMRWIVFWHALARGEARGCRLAENARVGYAMQHYSSFASTAAATSAKRKPTTGTRCTRTPCWARTPSRSELRTHLGAYSVETTEAHAKDSSIEARILQGSSGRSACSTRILR